MRNEQIVRLACGTELSAKRWLTEARLRMLMNNLDPELAKRHAGAGYAVACAAEMGLKLPSVSA